MYYVPVVSIPIMSDKENLVVFVAHFDAVYTDGITLILTTSQTPVK